MRQFILFLLLLLPFMSIAQNVVIIDLGIIRGETKKKTIEIEKPRDRYSSSSLQTNAPHLQIEKKRVSLSDTVLHWQVIIDLQDRIGSQSDTLKLYTSDSVWVESFLVHYQILQPVQDVFTTYKNEYWPFRAKEHVFNLKSAIQGDTLTTEFDLYNFSGKSVDLKAAFVSDSISIQFDPVQVAHHGFTKAILEFATTDSSQVGFNRTIIPILQEGDTLAFFPIQYSIVPKKSSQNNVQINRSKFDFKVVKQGEIKNEVTFISNNGSEPIEILKIESNCECLTFEINETIIPPGGNVSLKVQFDSAGRSGVEQKSIYVFFNDISRQVATFTFKANIKQ